MHRSMSTTNKKISQVSVNIDKRQEKSQVSVNIDKLQENKSEYRSIDKNLQGSKFDISYKL